MLLFRPKVMALDNLGLKPLKLGVQINLSSFKLFSSVTFHRNEKFNKYISLIIQIKSCALLYALIRSCYEQNVCVPFKNSFVEAVTSAVSVFGDGISNEVIKVK
jgi:hypothetical protein